MEFTYNNAIYRHNETSDRYSKTENGKTRRISKAEYEMVHDEWMEAALAETEESIETEEIEEATQEATGEQGLTFGELMDLAKKHYNDGGDGVVECWDENTYNTYVKEFGSITRKVAFQIFGVDADARADAEFHNHQPAPKKARKSRRQVAREFEVDGHKVTLTDKQVDFIEHLPDTCFWENGLDSTPWVDCLCDEIGGQFEGKPMTVGAMVSTLREKGLIYTGTDKINGKKSKFLALTEVGKIVAGEIMDARYQ